MHWYFQLKAFIVLLETSSKYSVTRQIAAFRYLTYLCEANHRFQLSGGDRCTIGSLVVPAKIEVEFLHSMYCIYYEMEKLEISQKVVSLACQGSASCSTKSYS